MDETDLDNLDEAILNYLLRGREDNNPWGIGTPAVIRAELKDQGLNVPSRQTVNNRLVRMELAGHLENIQDKGEYRFVNDPREDNEEEE